MRAQTHSSQQIFSTAIVAGMVGAALGMLFAPKSGKQLREDMRHRMDDTKHSASEQRDKMREAYRENSADVKDTVHRAMQEVGELGEEAKIRASRIADDARKTSRRVKDDVRSRFASEDEQKPDEPVL